MSTAIFGVPAKRRHYGTVDGHTVPWPSCLFHPPLAAHFAAEEVACKHTGYLPPRRILEGVYFNALLGILAELRGTVPLIVNSWYRHPTHPVEAAKEKPGPHSTGLAVDVAVRGARAFELVRLVSRQFHSDAGVGVAQRGQHRFVHIDCCRHFKRDVVPVSRTQTVAWSMPRRPALWSYA